MTGDKSAANDNLKIEYLPDDGGVNVNGEWYASLERYFQHHEEELKEKKN